MSQPAFPTPDFYDEKQVGCSDGLSKRELFAAMVFQALIRRDDDIPFINPETDPLATELIPSWAKLSVVAADALIAALSRNKP